MFEIILRVAFGQGIATVAAGHRTFAATRATSALRSATNSRVLQAGSPRPLLGPWLAASKAESHAIVHHTAPPFARGMLQDLWERFTGWDLFSLRPPISGGLLRTMPAV